MKGRFGPNDTKKGKRLSWKQIAQELIGINGYGERTGDDCLKRCDIMVNRKKSFFEHLHEISRMSTQIPNQFSLISVNIDTVFDKRTDIFRGISLTKQKLIDRSDEDINDDLQTEKSNCTCIYRGHNGITDTKHIIKQVLDCLVQGSSQIRGFLWKSGESFNIFPDFAFSAKLRFHIKLGNN